MPTRSAGLSSKQPTAVSDSESEASGRGSPRGTHEQEFDFDFDFDFENLSPKGKGKSRTASSSSFEDQHGPMTGGASIESLAGSPVEGYINTRNYHNDDKNKPIPGDTLLTNPTEVLALDILGDGGLTTFDTDGHRALMSSSLFEFYCNAKAADILNAHSGTNKYTRDSEEAKELGKRMFQHTSKFLSKLGVLHHDLEGDNWEKFRNDYRQVLDQFGSTALKGVDLNVVESSHDVLAKQDGSAHRIALKDTVSENGLSRTSPLRIPSGRRLQGHNDQENVAPALGTFKPGSPHRDAFPAFTRPSYIQQDGLGRYTVEFAEEEIIGRGGFGTVWRVKHLMDKQEYAVKKIPLSAKQLLKLNRQTLEEIELEIETLAKLEHPNIVRYYGAWAEYGGPITTSAIPRSQSGKALALIENNAKSGEYAFDDAIENQGTAAGGDRNNNETSPREAEKEPSINILFENSSNKDGGVDEEVDDSILHESDDTESSETCDDEQFTDGNGSVDASGKFKSVPITLFMQMALYPMCLAKYIKPGSKAADRHCFHLLPALKIMLGVIDGVEYIHSKGIVHRDLKPGNIFLALPESGAKAQCPSCAKKDLETWSHPIPRIGDFGLVAEISHQPDTTEATSTAIVPRRVGTGFYRPHAFKTIDESLDVFALGVVLFELVYKFKTMFQRADVLSDLTCTPSPRNKSPTEPEFPKDFGPAMTNCVLKTCGRDTPGDEVQVIVEMTKVLILGMVEPDASKRWCIKEIRVALKALVARVLAARS